MTSVRSSGNATSPSVYGDDPVAAVARLAALGARWVHLVDLDRAYGTGSNRDQVRAIIAAHPATLAIQVGGALGSEDDVRELLDWGADRVVIGCGAVVRDPDLPGRLLERHGPERLAAAIDATDGRVTPRGRPVETDLAMETMGTRLYSAGCARVIYTDVRTDGALAGPDVAGARRLAALGLAVVASGGVGTLAHLAAVRAAGLAGVLVGRALHEGRFTLEEALACAA